MAEAVAPGQQASNAALLSIITLVVQMAARALRVPEGTSPTSLTARANRAARLIGALCSLKQLVLPILREAKVSQTLACALACPVTRRNASLATSLFLEVGDVGCNSAA